MKLDESYVARRQFLCCMIGGGAAVMGVGMVTPLIQYSGNLHPSPPPDFLVLEKDEFELAPGKAKMILYGHIPTLLLQPADAARPLLAFVAACTHLNCTVTYQEAQKRIFCACHEGCFDLEGQVVSGPPPHPLQQFFTRLNNGKLILALEEANLAKAT